MVYRVAGLINMFWLLDGVILRWSHAGKACSGDMETADEELEVAPVKGVLVSTGKTMRIFY